MKIEIYFDLVNAKTLEALENFKAACHTFAYYDQLEIVYKSYMDKDDLDSGNLHALVQYTKRNLNALDLIIDILKAKIHEGLSEKEVLDKCIIKYHLDADELAKALESQKYHRIVSHHMEHANLKGVKMTPYFIFENKKVLSGFELNDTYLQALIELYEYDSKQDYCVDDDCKRV